MRGHSERPRREVWRKATVRGTVRGTVRYSLWSYENKTKNTTFVLYQLGSYSGKVRIGRGLIQFDWFPYVELNTYGSNT